MILLKKSEETRKVKSTPAYYVILPVINILVVLLFLILGVANNFITTILPMILSLIFLIMSVIQKQFKGVYLNTEIISIVTRTFALLFIYTKIPSLVILMYVIALIIYAFSLIIVMLNANKYSLAQYLKEGYEIIDEENLSSREKEFIKKNKDINKPKYLLLDF